MTSTTKMSITAISKWGLLVLLGLAIAGFQGRGHARPVSTPALDKAVMESYGDRDWRALAEAMKPIQSTSCSGTGEVEKITCLRATQLIIIGLLKQERYGETLTYLEHPLASASWVTGEAEDEVSQICWRINEPIGRDFLRINGNWYGYLAAKANNQKLRGLSKRDFLHRAYACALMSRSDSIWVEDSSINGQSVRILLGGRIPDSDDKDSQSQYLDQLPKLYMAQVEKELGPKESAVASKIIREIWLPLSQRLNALREDRSLEFDKKALQKSVLYANAASAARDRDLPTVFVELLTALSKKEESSAGFYLRREGKFEGRK
jgi:hypothetical protein